MAQTKDTQDLKEIKKMLAELTAANEELRKENERLKADAPKKSEADIEARKWLEEEVPLYLFKDTGKYKGDVVVPFNGKNWVIQRGVEVMVPRYIYNVVRQSQAQKDMIEKRIEELENEYEKKK